MQDKTMQTKTLLAFVMFVLVFSSGVFALNNSVIIGRAILYENSHNILKENYYGSDEPCILTNPYTAEKIPLTGYGTYSYNGDYGSLVYFPVSYVSNYVIDSGRFSYSPATGFENCYSSYISFFQYPNYYPYNYSGPPLGVPVYVTYDTKQINASDQLYADINVDSGPQMFSLYNNSGELLLGTKYVISRSCTSGLFYYCPQISSNIYGMFVNARNTTANPNNTGIPNATFYILNYKKINWNISTGSGSSYVNFDNLTIGQVYDMLSHVSIDHTSLNVSALGNLVFNSEIYDDSYAITLAKMPSELCNPIYKIKSTIIDTYQLSLGNYLYLCMNLNSTHAGRNFTGVMVIKKAVPKPLIGNGELDIDLYLESPESYFFSDISFDPIVPTSQANLTVKVDFAYPMFGRMFYQRKINNALQPMQNISSGYGTHHEFLIPQGELQYQNVTITIYIEALNDPINPTTIFQKLESTTVVTNQTPIYQQVITSITPYDDVVNKVGSGLNLIIDTAPCPICVPPQNHVSIPAYCKVDNGTEKGTVLYSITRRNSTSPASAHVVNFAISEIGGFGFHNITCRPTLANSYQFQQNTTTLFVNTDPYYTLVKLPSAPTCDAVVLKYSKNECESAVQDFISELPYYNSWYCSQRGPPNYPADYCKYWDGYACTNSSLILPPNVINGSYQNPNCALPVSNVTGNITNPPENLTIPPYLENETIKGFIYQALGMSVYTFLNFISLIISVAVAAAVAIKSRSGLATGVVFVGMVMVFALIGWLPFWVLVILAVITAFIVAKFGTDLFTGGGGK